jgi:uncharacterized DUF497 family protein
MDEFTGFEWDSKKSDWTLRVRGFDFASAATVFEDAFCMDRDDERRDYGEARCVTIGLAIAEGVPLLLAVTWTPRGTKRRIISARFASPSERLEYARFRGTF